MPASPLGRNTGPAATAAAGVRNATPVTPGAGPAGTASLARNIGPTIQPNGQNGGPHGTPGTSTLPRNIGPGANTPGSPGTGNGHGELSPFGRAGDGAAGAGERAFRAADPATRAVALAAVGVAEMETGDLVAAGYALAAGLAEARAAGLTRPASACAGRLAVVHAVRGELREAGEAARAYPGGSPADRAHAHLALALVALHRDELAETAAHLDRAAPPAPADGGVPVPDRAGAAFPALVAVAHAGLLEARGDLAAAHRAISAARGERALPPMVERWLAIAEADLHTARGDAAGARVLLGPVAREAGGAGAGREDAPRATGEAAGAVALARAHLCAGDPTAALRALPPWDDIEVNVPLAVRVDAGLLAAIAARRAGDHRRAARDLEAVLGMAGPEGFRRSFTRGGTDARDLLGAHLDAGTAFWPLVADLVAAMPPPAAADPPASPETGETLTERELTVLRYLQSMLSTVEIAGELSLSVNTVKTHVRNIYRKLSATRRREAVRRGRELRLI
ncbi:hypothetical protein Pflav_034190 [Phytohabitans flavus]|uniref:HTH luxR-type domain-containing protein n=1 Tax=Phytohabitans flavus TaxID=1076124 RepID=A0A6F8XT84_9ACTN|nr:hypothetical protein Pflav_034190 [Phytohabitans flavus]